MPVTEIVRSGSQQVVAATAGQTGILMQPLLSGVEHEVRRVFRDRFVADRLQAMGDHELRAYEAVSLEWYLTHGRRQSRAIIVDGRVRGCVLVCLDGGAYDRWVQTVTAQWVSTAMGRYLTGSVPDASRQFVRHRLSDGLRRRHGRLRAVFSAHARLHLDGGIDEVDVVPSMVREVDEIVRAAGLPGWDAQVNLSADRPVAACWREPLPMVHRMRSETLSWLHGRPVDRARFARRIPRDSLPAGSAGTAGADNRRHTPRP